MNVLLLLAAFTIGTVVASKDDLLITEKVFLDLTVGERKIGRVVIGLFGKTAPKTVRNFMAYCTHEP